MEPGAVGAVSVPAAAYVPMTGKQPSWDNLQVSGDARGGRNTAQMQQDVHGIQGTMRELAEGTGGRAIGRSGDITSTLNSVVQDGLAAYLLSFSHNTAADNQYHLLTVTLTSRRGVTLRYRTGYFYAKEATASRSVSSGRYGSRLISTRLQ